MCETLANSEVAMDGYKLRRYGRLVEYICSKPQAIFLRHVVAGKSAVQQIDWCRNVPIASTRGQLMILQCALLLIMDPQSHRMDFLCPASVFLGISVKSLLSKGHPGRSRTRAHSLDFHFPRVNRVLCTGVGVVIVYLQYCVGGTWLKCIK
jgi:hypothetical protein